MPCELSAQRARDAIHGEECHALLTGASFSLATVVADVARIVADLIPGLKLVPQGVGGELHHLVRAPSRSQSPTATELLFPPSTGHMELHTDGAYLPAPGVDYVALACVGRGRSGGTSTLLTGTALLERVAAVDPSAARRLFEPFPFSALEARTPDDIVWHPVVAKLPRGVAVTLHRFRMQQAYARLPGGADSATAHALDVVGAALREEALHIRHRLSPGDLLVLDNRRVLHGREPFTDGGERERRQIVRVWFARATPDVARA